MATHRDADAPAAGRAAPPRRRGRPVSQASRQAVLDRAVELLDERGLTGFTVDEVARRSGVSKATIYKHWRSGLEIAVEAYGAVVTSEVPVLSTGDVVADLTDQVRRLAAVYAGPRGPVIAQLLAAGTRPDTGSGLLRTSFFAQRRADTAALVESGIASGQLRSDLDVDLVIDLLFGAIVFRLFNGGPPLDPTHATALATMAVRAVGRGGELEPS